jgi:hypothetical protein
MGTAAPIAFLVIAVILGAGHVGAETVRLEGRLPDKVPLVSIDQTRGTVLDALDAISKQAGWSLVVTAPESARSRALAIQIRRRPADEALNLVLEAGALRATFADGVLRVRPDTAAADTAAASGDPVRERKSGRSRDEDKGERVVVGGSARVEANEVVTKVVAVGGSVTVLGHVLGEAVAVGGSVKLHPESRVDGDAVAIGGTVTVQEGARLGGSNVSVGGEPVAWIVGLLSPLWASALLVSFAWTRALLLFVIVLLVVLAFPTRVASVRTFLASRPGISSLAGLALLLGFVPLCVLLAVTIIGIPLIPVAVMLLIALFLFGITVCALWLGERIPLLQENKTPLKAAALGGAVLVVVGLIPWIGTAVIVLAALMAAGATLLSRFGQRVSVPA